MNESGGGLFQGQAAVESLIHWKFNGGFVADEMPAESPASNNSIITSVPSWKFLYRYRAGGADGAPGPCAATASTDGVIGDRTRAVTTIKMLQELPTQHTRGRPDGRRRAFKPLSFQRKEAI